MESTTKMQSKAAPITRSDCAYNATHTDLETEQFQKAGAVKFIRTPPRNFNSSHYIAQNFAKASRAHLNQDNPQSHNYLSTHSYDRTSFRYYRDQDWKYYQIANSHQNQPSPVVAILPPPENFIKVIMLHIIEVLNGQRPAKHLRIWMSPQAYQALVRRARLGMEIHGQAAKCAAPQIRKVRVFQPTPRAVEAAIVLFDGRKIRGAALRLETQKDRWQIAEIEVI